MTTKKRIQPGEKLPLKLTVAERALVLAGLLFFDDEYKQILRETAAGKPILLTLGDLDDLGGHVAAGANHTQDKKLKKKLDAIFQKIQNFLGTYTDKDHVDHDSVVKDWQQNSERNDGKNYTFLRSLKHRSFGFDSDKLATKLHDKAFQIVDCTRCANCCKTMTVKLEQTDIDRIAKHLDMTGEKFIETYLEPDDAEGLYKIRQQPCPFLGNDDRCMIYDVRPADCREYPHTAKEGFTSRTITHANNALRCPAVFWIVEQMRHRARG